MDEIDLAALPYDSRRLVAVVDERADPQNEKDEPRRWDVAVRALGALVPTYGLVVLAAGAAYNMWQEDRRMPPRSLLTLTPKQAAELGFPLGHPRTGIVYAGHPADHRVYVPAADFHRFLFEHKVAEAQRLLRSLGASRIEVERIEGWDQTVGVSVSAGIPASQPLSAGGEFTKDRGAKYSVLATMELEPSGKPFVPEDLVWISHEPLWQEIAAARLASGLKSFTLDVRSTDDYGVDAKLTAAVGKAGFDVGGKFREHTSTIWRMVGTFGPIEPQV